MSELAAIVVVAMLIVVAGSIYEMSAKDEKPQRIRIPNLSGLRCGVCCVTWPPYMEFELCPCCRTECKKFWHEEPDYDYDEARSLANHYEFERYLADTGREHLIEGNPLA